MEMKSSPGASDSINIKRGRLVAIMTIAASILAIYASVMGIFNESVYTDVFMAGTISEKLIPGSIAQDIITIPLGLILAALSLLFLKSPKLKTFTCLVGLSTYLFYAYGLYVIEGQYTSIYLIYMAVFALSMYSMIFGLMSFQHGAGDNIKLPKALRISVCIFMFMILLVLIPGWIIKITADIARHIPADTYAVYLLDLCIVFPAIGIILVKFIQKKPLSNVFTAIALFKVVTVCLSWGFGEWYPPLYYGLPMDFAMTAIPTVLTAAGLVLTFLYMSRFKEEASL